MKLKLIEEPYETLDSALYMIGGGQKIKFGRSTNPFKRLKDLQTGNPSKLRVMAVSWPMEEGECKQMEKTLLKFSGRFACDGGSEWLNADAQDNFERFLGGDCMVIPDDFDIDSYGGLVPNCHGYSRKWGDGVQLPFFEFATNPDSEKISMRVQADPVMYYDYLLKNKSIFDWFPKLYCQLLDQADPDEMMRKKTSEDIQT